MKKMRKVLMSALVAAPLVAVGQPGVMNSEAAGYLERGRQMYESHNYVGCRPMRRSGSRPITISP